MAKLVVLKLDGDLEIGGFRASLEIKEGDRVLIEITRSLPPNPELAAEMQRHWQEYRNLGLVTRIKPGSIKHNFINPNKFSTRLKEIKESGEKLGNLINQWLKSEQFRDIDRGLREELNRTEKVRVLVRTEDNYLRKLPWHLWDFIDRYSFSEVALSPIEYKSPQLLPIAAKSKVRVLAILGCSAGIDIEKDRELLKSLPNAEVVFLLEPKHNQINDKLWEQPWDIIFFAGHGETDEDTGRIHINETDSLTLDEVWYGLKKAVVNGLQLAIFNSCDGLGLAQRLDDLEIPQMIVMREMVPDFVAQQFLKDFLTNFASGNSLYQAFREAREKLQGLETDFPCASWLPIICQNPSVEPPTWNDLIPQRRGFNLFQIIIQCNFKFKWAVLLLLTGGSVGWLYGLPKLAVLVNDFGFDLYQKGDLITARKAFLLAEILNPDNRVVPYTLGWLCQDMQDIKCAREKYQRSAKLGFAGAYSQLGRLLIVYDKNYNGAVNLLWQGLELAKDDATKYSLLKNIGWARLEQGRYEEALTQQNAAIKLDNNRASAYCLKAQVLEGMNDKKGALKEWQTCLKFADQKIADEDVWIGKARARLNLK
ncbi:CHAT domain-containing protein [Kamptonema sp. UHCC 0994]|uniref:CHAT domain-containing tetratricopeptide repeat protein n=1 Tax=Kamptonema sp. UHCC 0994 TaxID=3031329 RepID=UPI0023B993DE|nr:CHAT domain-containing protein [Kamptonema sp. UHCC 0994]MDF0553949.1 CHAT domain-containing protein [Kamptonema sp. UHCC 0994]